VMDLVNANVPVKIVSLGHRSGAVIMVRKDSPYRTFKDLIGKRIAIPSRFAVDFLFLRKMLAKEGISPKDYQILEMAPPDMPGALYANAVEAYCVGEPFGAAAQRAGYAIPLRMTRDEWPNYICCVLTVRQELIDQNPRLVQDLVNYIQGAGQWLDAERPHRNRAAEIASDSKYFGQDRAIIQYVMDNPTDRVTYGDLRMIKEEFEELMELSLQAGTLKRPIAFDKYVDERFVRAAAPASIAV
jgi:NitT/TauT family transport system substrate-binding protein